MAFYADSKNVVGRTLQVTEFCPDGNLVDHRTCLYKLSEIEKQTAKIFSQMASAFSKIEQTGCAFPDAKITNWLVDRTGNLRLADTKSVLFAEEGKVTHSDPNGPNKYYGLILSRCLIPPEFSNSTFDAGKGHSYLLGKNLYLYITGEEYVNEDNGAEFDFDYDLFQKSRFGTDYKQLIEGLVQDAPENRMSINEALARLQVIEQLTTLNTLQTGNRERNRSIKNYVHEKHEQFRNAPLEQISEIAQEIGQEIQKKRYETAIEKLSQLKSGNQTIDDEIIDTYIEKTSKEFNEAILEEKAQIIQKMQNEMPAIEQQIQFAVTSAELDKLKFGISDKEMADYLDKQQQYFKTATPDKQKEIIQAMRLTAQKLQEDPAIAEIRTIINNFREKASTFTIGMKAKADRIESEMAKVPLEARCDFMKYQHTKEIVNVINQLASKRSLRHNGMIPVTDDGGVDEKKAAASFNDFKNKFQEQRVLSTEKIEEETPTEKIR